MTLLKIEQRHIDKGQKASCQFCPIALALRELLNDDYYPHVSSTKIGIKETNTGETKEIFWMPKIMTDFI